tara:strand:+ start:44 stop:598 length:555 start_codon:yes stop_codon:yes gene_type:complete
MKLEEAIIVVKPVIEDVFFENIINYMNHTCNKKLTISGERKVDLNIRNVIGHTLSKNKISDKVYFKHIQDVITKNYYFYKLKFPQISTSNLNQIDLLKYEPGGKYEIHTDHGYEMQRTLTCIINLNQDYEGGDFVFYKQNGKEEMKRVKCEKGTMIFFPSNFLYPHRIEPITKGLRYSIVSWLI